MRVCVTAALIAMMMSTSLLAATWAGYRYQRSIDYAPNIAQPLVAVPLDDAVYGASADQFVDLRLRDGEGVETPFLLQKVAENKQVTERLPLLSDIVTLQKNGEAGIAITLVLDKNARDADGFTVQTDMQNFEYTLQIMGSEEGKQWVTLIDHAPIYDYSRFMAVSNREVALPSNHYRYFKIVVVKAVQSQLDDVTMMTRTLSGDKELSRDEQSAIRNQPLHISGVRFWHNQTEMRADAEQRVNYPVGSLHITQNEKDKTTLIDFSTTKQPLNSLNVTFTSPHFSRLVEAQILDARGVADRWHRIASDRLSVLQVRDIHHQNTTLSFAEQRQSAYRLVIHNQDNPPVDISAITGVGPVYELLFLPEAGKHYQLVYGADNRQTPNYDVAPVRELLRRGYTTTPATLGAIITLAETHDRSAMAQVVNSSWFLGAVIGVMVLVLGWSLFKVASRVKNMPD
jgi:hypothetical protein